MLNCIKQIYVINTSKVVLITDNNYVISNFKRPGVKVIQVWHATGAIKSLEMLSNVNILLKIMTM